MLKKLINDYRKLAAVVPDVALGMHSKIGVENSCMPLSIDKLLL